MAVATHIGHFRVFHETLGMVVMPPLSDKSRVVRHTLLLFGFPHREFHHPVILVGSDKQIQMTVILVRVPTQRVSFTGDSIGSIFLAKAERDVIDSDAIIGQQFSGIAVATFKIGSRPELIETETMSVERQ